MRPSEKIVDSLVDMKKTCASLRCEGKTIVLTHGCFDLLHAGHVEYICDAAEHGFLVVGINSDKFVKRLKGNDRPIRSEEDRAFTLAAMYPVELVNIFDDRVALIEAVQPDVYVTSVTTGRSVYDDLDRMKLLTHIGTEIVVLESKRPSNSSSKMLKQVV